MAPRPPARFVGVDLSLVKKGESVVIVAGEHEGRVCEVVSVDGNAFRMESSRIVVEIDGERCWLHPWNIRPTREL